MLWAKLSTSLFFVFIGAQTATASERSVWDGVDAAIFLGLKKHRNRDYDWQNLQDLHAAYAAGVRRVQELESNHGRPVASVTEHAEIYADRNVLLTQALRDEKEFERQRNIVAGTFVTALGLVGLYKLR